MKVALQKQMTDTMHFVYFVNLYIGGMPATFLVDTGCSVTCVDREFYDRNLKMIYDTCDAEIMITSLTETKRTNTAWQRLKDTVINNGRPSIEAVRDIPVAFPVGGIARTLPAVLITKLTHMSNGLGVTVDGLLGLDALDLFRANMHYNGELHLFNPVVTKTEALASA